VPQSFYVKKAVTVSRKGRKSALGGQHSEEKKSGRKEKRFVPIILNFRPVARRLLTRVIVAFVDFALQCLAFLARAKAALRLEISGERLFSSTSS
jgi:hypothetical protein